MKVFAPPMGEVAAFQAFGQTRPVNLYLFRDEFITAASAPLTSPRLCEPGPGQVDVNDPNAKISVTSGNIQAATGGTAQTTNVATHGMVPYQPGLALKLVGYKEATGGTAYIGWSQAAGNDLSVSFRGTLQVGFYRGGGGGASMAIPASVDSTARDFVFVRNAAGGQWVFRDYHLIVVDRSVNQAVLRGVGMWVETTTVTPVLSALRVFPLSGVLATTEGIAWVNTTAVSGTLQSLAPADGIHELAFVQPVSPASGDKAELRVRYLDTNNYITAFLIWNSGTSQWDLQLWKNVAGVLTQIGSTVANVGTVTNLFLQIVGTAITVWTRSSLTVQGTRRIAGAAVPSSSQTGSMAVVAQGSWTLGNIWAYSDTALPDGTLYSAALNQ